MKDDDRITDNDNSNNHAPSTDPARAALTSHLTNHAPATLSLLSPPRPPPSTTPLSFLTHLHLWQLLDSAYPVGSFAHSNGLEAAVTVRLVHDRQSLLSFTRLSLLHTAASQLPTLTHTHRCLQRVTTADELTLAELNRWYDATCTSSIQRAASIALAHSFLHTFTSTHHTEPTHSAATTALTGLPQLHYPLVYAASLWSLQLPLPWVLLSHLHLTLRSVMSAAVRLNVLGPREAQQVQSALMEYVLKCVSEWEGAVLEDSYGVQVMDVMAQMHGRLHTRLFVT